MTSLRTLTADEHTALDRPIWSALTTGHRALALGGPLARRYPPEISPFCAIVESTPAAFEALRALIGPDEQGALCTTAPLEVPAGFETRPVGAALQMVATAVPQPAGGSAAGIMALGNHDAPEMLQLAALTKPGPFGPRTHEFGGFMGIRDRGVLVAMAGERMRLDGLVEVSGICVHPEQRGRGYAQLLTLAVMRAILARGSIPFLHVFANNEPAIALYRRLGFVSRQQMFISRIWPV